MNHVSLIGNLTKDPELREIQDGKRKVCDLRIAVNDGREDRDPLYIDVATFDGSAEACAKYLKKGRRIGIDGRLVYREWKAEDGSPRSRHSVIGRVEFLDSKSSSEEPEAVAAGNGVEEDIPF